MIGEVALAAGDINRAIQELKRGLSCAAYTKEKGIAIFYRLGCLYEETSNCDKAREAFQKVYVVNPNFEDIRELIVIVG